jgi:Fic family protein
MEFEYTPQYTITGEMLDLVGEIMERLGGLSAVGDLSKQPNLRRINRLKSIHSSTAIEGNTLTLEQVTAVVNGKIVLAPPNEVAEIKQAFAAYELLEKINPYDIKDMLKIHSVMMKDLVKECGKFRTQNVGVYNGKVAVHIAPPPVNVPPLAYKLYDWLKNAKIHDLIKSSIFHYEFEFIHPFNDGNGRMGRFLQSAILAKWKPIFAWIPIETIIKQRQKEYYDAFKACYKDDGKSNHFIIFMLNAILEAVKATQDDTKKFLKSQTIQIQNLMKMFESEHESLSANDIAKMLGLKSTRGLREKYLEPAIKLGLVKMTEPDKPTSKHQKYFKA